MLGHQLAVLFWEVVSGLWGATDMRNSEAGPSVALLTPGQHPFLSNHHLTVLGVGVWGVQRSDEIAGSM